MDRARSIYDAETAKSGLSIVLTLHYAQMYGPPPNCKRFEVDEGQSA